jgi:hypothetical protein
MSVTDVSPRAVVKVPDGRSDGQLRKDSEVNSREAQIVDRYPPVVIKVPVRRSDPRFPKDSEANSPSMFGTDVSPKAVVIIPDSRSEDELREGYGLILSDLRSNRFSLLAQNSGAAVRPPLEPCADEGPPATFVPMDRETNHPSAPPDDRSQQQKEVKPHEKGES